MLLIRKLDEGGTWGAFDQHGRQLLLIELKRPECYVRRYERQSRGGRGRLLAIFLGEQSLCQASEWAARCEPEDLTLFRTGIKSLDC